MPTTDTSMTPRSTSPPLLTLNLFCSSCHAGHYILERGEAAWPVCFVASDHCFPACLPAADSGRCCAIIRVEDSSLAEIMTAVRNILGNKKLPVGTVFLLSSASHLARAGTAKYAGGHQNHGKRLWQQHQSDPWLPDLQISRGEQAAAKKHPGHHGLAVRREQKVPGPRGGPV